MGLFFFWRIWGVKEINDKEKKLLSYIRRLEYGEVRVVVQDGHPIRLEEIKKTVKL